MSRFPRSRRRLVAANASLGAALAVLSAAPVKAQVAQWTIGGSGLSWSSQAQIQAGVMSRGTSINPLELAVGQNLTRELKWTEGQPEEFTLEGNPRVWDNAGTGGGSSVLVDGRDTTSTGDRFQKNVSQLGRAFFFDLGVAFPINRMRFYPPPGEEGLAIRAFEVFSSDGNTFDGIGRPVWQSLRRVDFSDTAVVDLRFPVSQVRFVQLRTLARDGFDLAEVEIYGEGFVPKASYLSQLHKLDAGPANFGRVVVAAAVVDRGRGSVAQTLAAAFVQVRSGADDTPLTYYRRDQESGTEVEVSETQYKSLIIFEQGPIRADGENWSPWSTPMRLDSTGTFALSLDLPSPRQYLQLRLNFEGPATQAIKIDQLALEYTLPLVSVAQGELALATDPAPLTGVATVPAGVETTFVYDIRVRFTQDSQEGFKGIRLASFPAPAFARLEMGDPLAVVQPDSVVPQADGFAVYFPAVTRKSNPPIRLTFNTTLFDYTTLVDAWLMGAAAGLPHPVAPGDASDEVRTGSNQILAAAERPAVDLAVSGAGFTPNGDGANDSFRLSYVLSQFARPVQVRLGVHDLSGREVRSLFAGDQSAGRHDSSWDGRNGQGAMVAPGIYLCRLSVEADARTFTQTRLVGVVY